MFRYGGTGEGRAPSNATQDRGVTVPETATPRARFTVPPTVQLSPGFFKQSRRQRGGHAGM